MSFLSDYRVVRGMFICMLFATVVLSVSCLAETNPRELMVRRDEKIHEKRMALVIGNAAYQASPLHTPVNDATAVSAALQQLGFQVHTLFDADQRTMETAIRTFGRSLRQGGIGLFYYAGHGIQVAGSNFLVPLGARLQEESDVRYEAIALGRVLDAMDKAGNPLNIVILDACRDNLFTQSWRRARRTQERGLAAVQAMSGTLIAYATAPGSVVAEGEGRNSLYTEHLLRYIDRAGTKYRMDV